MIHELTKRLQASLTDRKVPFAVYEREATKPATWARERIVVEYDDKTGDDFRSPISQTTNPKVRMVRSVSAKLTIYAQSTRGGAEDFEHRRRANRVLDQVLVSLAEIFSALPGLPFLPTGGAFVTPEDLAGTERYGGAVYELRFAVPRAIAAVTWTSDELPTATVGADGVSIRGTTVVKIAGSDDGEVACGGA